MKPIAESSMRGGFEAGAARTNEPPSTTAGPESPWISALGHFGEISRHVQTLFALRVERQKLVVRRWAHRVVIVAIVATALVPLILAGVSLFVLGLVQGMIELFDGRAWLGNLVTGVLILGALALFGWMYSARVARHGLAKKVAKYGDIPRENSPAD
jgi:hypothetical protein